MTTGDRARQPRILGVFAHPDDESFGPGGTIAKYAAAGAEISILTLTKGERSTMGTSLDHSPEQLALVREAETHEAGRILGLTNVHVLSYPDSRLVAVPLDDLVRTIAASIAEIKPHVILTFDTCGVSAHPDHIITSLAVDRAFRLANTGPSRRGYSGPSRLFYWVIPMGIATEVNQSTGAHMIGKLEEEITCSIDVSEHLHVQHQAVLAHATQSTPLPLVYMARTAAQGGKEFLALGASAITDDRPDEHDILGGLTL